MEGTRAHEVASVETGGVRRPDARRLRRDKIAARAGLVLAGLIVVLGLGTLGPGRVAAQGQDIIGVWFDAAAQQDSVATTAAGQIVTAYLAILNPSVTGPISGWECIVEVAGEGIEVKEWVLAQGLNIDEPPRFHVGIGRFYELQPTPVVVLATATLEIADAQSRGWIYVHPYHPASLQDPPGSGNPVPVCVYAPTSDPGDLKRLAWSSGEQARPVAVINPGAAGPVCHLESDRLRFGLVAVGAERQKTLALANVGGAPALGEIVAPAGVDFTVVAGGGSYELAPGETRELTVRYAPATADADTTVMAACGEMTLIGGGFEAGACTVTPPSLGFGNVSIGEESCLGFTVSNASSQAIAGEVGGVEAPFRIGAGQGAFFLEPQQSREVVVCFAPTAMAPASGAVAVSSCGTLVSLQGVGAEPPARCAVMPASLDFGTLAAGESAALSFAVRNAGGHVIAGTVGGATPPFEVVTGGGPFSLAAQESLQVSVRYAPTAPGQHTTAIDLGTGLCEPVACLGGVPLCEVSADTLDFGVVGLRDTPLRLLTLRNAGGGVLAGSIVLASGPFALTDAPSGRLPYRLAAGAALEIYVRFEPVALGAFEASLEIGGGCAPVALLGTGVEPQPLCQVTPDTLDFGVVAIGRYLERRATIKNVGTGLLTGKIAEECADFYVQEGSGQFALGAGASRLVRVSYSPHSVGQVQCAITTGTARCSAILCVATGAAPQCGVQPSSLAFGPVAVGQTRDLSFVVKNVGVVPLPANVTLASTEFGLQAGGGTFELQPGQERNVTVRFHPRSAGSKACTVFMGTACSALPCTGTADYPQCALEPAALDFGTVGVGASVERSLLVGNTGTVPFSVPVACSGTEFRLAGAYSPLALAPAESRLIGVVCEPTSVGDKTATIEIGSNWRQVACTAHATTVQCAVSPSSLDFGTLAPGATADLGFAIVNGGVLPASGTVALSAGGPFSLVSGGGAYALEPGATWEVVVRFAPAADGPWDAVVTTGAECGDVTCSGVGQSSPPVCEVSPARLDFGYVAVDDSLSLPVTIRNAGGGALAGRAALTGPDFRVVEGGLFRLGPAASQTVVVQYGPLASGSHADTLRAGDGCLEVPCAGQGLAGSLDRLAVFFDARGARNEIATATSYEPVTAYLAILGPGEPTGASGWECAVEIAGDVTGPEWTCEGGGVNIAAPPLFQVGLPAAPLPWAPVMLLASVRFLQASPLETTRIFVHPYAQPSLPGVPVYSAGDDPGRLIPLGWPAGRAADPVAVVNGSVADDAPGDVLGVYFDAEATQTRHTAAADEPVTAYLVMLNPAHGYPGLGAWEVCVELAGAARDPVWELAAGGVNAAEAPCFRVSYPESSPCGAPRVVLATLRFVQTSPYEATSIFLHPPAEAAVAGRMSYGNRQLPHLRFPLAWSSGDEAVPVAVVEPGSMPVPQPAVSYGGDGVTVSWSAVAGQVDGYHVYRQVGAEDEVRRTTWPLPAGAPSMAYVDDVAGLPAGATLRYSYAALRAGLEIARSAKAVFSLPAVPMSRTGLRSVYPNPCNPTAQVEFELARPGPARLEVFDLAGRRVQVLCADVLPAGEHRRQWDGCDERGKLAPSGTYYVRLLADGREEGQTLTLLR